VRSVKDSKKPHEEDLKFGRRDAGGRDGWYIPGLIIHDTERNFERLGDDFIVMVLNKIVA